MSCEVAISLLLSLASLQPSSAGGWGNPGSSSSPSGPHRWGFFGREPQQVLTSLGGLGWAPRPPGSGRGSQKSCCKGGNVSSCAVPAQGMAGTPSKHHFLSIFPALPGFHTAKAGPCLRLLPNLLLRKGWALPWGILCCWGGDGIAVLLGQDTHLHLSQGQFVAPLWSKQALENSPVLCCVTEGAGVWEVQPPTLVNIPKG